MNARYRTYTAYSIGGGVVWATRPEEVPAGPQMIWPEIQPPAMCGAGGGRPGDRCPG